MHKEQMAAEAEQGVVFPKNSTGKRSSTATVKQILANSVEDIDLNLGKSILNEKKWRRRYPVFINRINLASIASGDHALQIAKKGLNAAYQTMRFIRDNEEMTLDEAMTAFDKPRFHTAVINGNRPLKNTNPFILPYKGRILSDRSLLRQTDQWEQEGLFEPSFGKALRNVTERREWMNLSGQTFVLMGAGSEIAPFAPLLNSGATVIAIDLERPAIWERLIEIARNSPGRLILPLKKPFKAGLRDDQIAGMAGADLSCDAPEIRTWLLNMNRPMTIGAYAYADGALHVRIAMAMDAVIKDIIAKREDVSIAFLLTPSDSFAVPVTIAKTAQSRFKQNQARSFLYSAARLISMGTMFAPHNHDLFESSNGQSYGLSDNIIIQQGPSYILAKNIQKWRALAARNRGVRVSANVAPATTTRSVFNNKLLAAGYAGLAYFKAEAFVSETTRAMMTAALINDLNDKTAAANPGKTLAHPLELFMEAANHGGLWNVACLPRSVLAFSVCLGSLKTIKQRFLPGTAGSRTKGEEQQETPLVVKNL